MEARTRVLELESGTNILFQLSHGESYGFNAWSQGNHIEIFKNSRKIV